MVTTSRVLLALLVNSVRRASPTWRAAALVGSTRSSGVPKWTWVNGRPSTTRKMTTGAAAAMGRRMTAVATRRQNGDSGRPNAGPTIPAGPGWH